MEYRFSDRGFKPEAECYQRNLQICRRSERCIAFGRKPVARCISLKGDCGNLGKGFCRRSDFGFAVQRFGGLHSAEKAPYGIYEKGA